MATRGFTAVSFDESGTRKDAMHRTIEEQVGEFTDLVDEAAAIQVHTSCNLPPHSKTRRAPLDGRTGWQALTIVYVETHVNRHKESNKSASS